MITTIPVKMFHRFMTTSYRLLSELGEHLPWARQVPAGTKRFSNLLRCPHWRHPLIQKNIRAKAQTFYEQLHQQGQQVLILLDESVMEKPETLAGEDLGAVRSSKARRLKRIRPGYYNPPDGKPVFVPALEWLGILLAGASGAPCLYAFEWWTRRGEHARQRADVLSPNRKAVLRSLSTALSYPNCLHPLMDSKFGITHV